LQNVGVGFYPNSVAIADLNGDGVSDVVTANYSTANDVTVLIGTGAGDFSGKANFGVGAAPWAVVIGDVNEDGNRDLVTANLYAHNASVLLGTGAGSVGAPTMVALKNESYPYSVAVGDLNGDGKPDLAAAYSGQWQVAVLPGVGMGGFGGPTTYELNASPRFLVIDDLDRDGKPDLVAASSNAYTVSVLVGKGAAGFAMQKNFSVASPPWSLATGDLNGDGLPDLATANSASSDVTIRLSSVVPPTLPTIAGFDAYGIGTWGCAGQLGLNANSLPALGNSAFGLVGTNAPRNVLGLMLGTDVQDVVGSDPFYASLVVHVGLSNATEVLSQDVFSGSSGEQFVPASIPNHPAILGQTYFLQTFWVEPPDQRCTSGLAGLESSRGLAVTIQP
jgi:hypothetical protein